VNPFCGIFVILCLGGIKTIFVPVAVTHECCEEIVLSALCCGSAETDSFITGVASMFI
jgi:hypothetical protein